MRGCSVAAHQPAAAMPGKASHRGLPEPLFAGAAVLEATLKRLHAAEGRLWEMSCSHSRTYRATRSRRWWRV